MNIQCGKCQTVLRINEDRYLQETLIVQCPKCSQKIRVRLPVKQISLHELQMLHNQIITQQNVWLGGKMTEVISQLLEKLCRTPQQAIILLNSYQNLFKSNLIKDLIKINSSYSEIRKNLSWFIQLGIIEENYPHNYRTEEHPRPSQDSNIG
jgi:predicted Zn finger-like uncharacterized protein